MWLGGAVFLGALVQQSGAYELACVEGPELHKPWEKGGRGA